MVPWSTNLTIFSTQSKISPSIKKNDIKLRGFFFFFFLKYKVVAVMDLTRISTIKRESMRVSKEH